MRLKCLMQFLLPPCRRQRLFPFQCFRLLHPHRHRHRQPSCLMLNLCRRCCLGLKLLCLLHLMFHRRHRLNHQNLRQ
jgi:hypothetical protein